MTETRIAVLFGGPSAEHEISIDTARNVSAALLEAGVSVVPAFWRREGDWHLGAEIRPRHDALADELVANAFEGVDSALPVPPGSAAMALSRVVDGLFCCVHGDLGEDGCVQGLFRVLGVPMVGSSVLGSALAMDKSRAKDVLRSRKDVSVLPSVLLGAVQWRLDPTGSLAQVKALGFPVVVKPGGGGSSVGLSKVERWEDTAAAVDRAQGAHSSGAMVEKFVAGDELSCVVLGNVETGLETLPPILIRPLHGGLFDYESKYRKGGAEELSPAPISESLTLAVQKAAVAVYEALDGRGFARVDFIAEGEKLWFLEMNTLPGFTSGSLAPKAVAAAGMTRAEFVRRLLDLAGIGGEAVEAQARAVGRG